MSGAVSSLEVSRTLWAMRCFPRPDFAECQLFTNIFLYGANTAKVNHDRAVIYQCDGTVNYIAKYVSSGTTNTSAGGANGRNLQRHCSQPHLKAHQLSGCHCLVQRDHTPWPLWRVQWSCVVRGILTGRIYYWHEVIKIRKKEKSLSLLCCLWSCMVHMRRYSVTDFVSCWTAAIHTWFIEVAYLL